MQTTTVKIIGDATKNHAISLIRQLEGGAKWEVVIRPFRRKRSNDQNRLLHMWCKEISEGMLETHGHIVKPAAVKEDLAQLFLGEVTFEGLRGPVTRRRSTTDLTVREFSEFLEKIDWYAADELGINLTHPVDLYMEALGRAA